MTTRRLLLLLLCLLLPSLSFARISSVRIVNDTSSPLYIHIGGYAPSRRIEAGRWIILNYPFVVIPPNSKKPTRSGILIATTGGRWMTTPNGFTYLNKPKLCSKLDYSAPRYQKLTGRRQWVIRVNTGIGGNCKVTGFRQLWWQPAETEK